MRLKSTQPPAAPELEGVEAEGFDKGRVVQTDTFSTFDFGSVKSSVPGVIIWRLDDHQPKKALLTRSICLALFWEAALVDSFGLVGIMCWRTSRSSPRIAWHYDLCSDIIILACFNGESEESYPDSQAEA